MKFKTIAATLVISAAYFSHPAYAVEARGMRSCGTWVKQRAESQGLAHFASESWLLGYLSGIAFATTKDVLKGTDNESIYLWMDNYCRANPLKDIFDGGAALFFELGDKK